MSEAAGLESGVTEQRPVETGKPKEEVADGEVVEDGEPPKKKERTTPSWMFDTVCYNLRRKKSRLRDLYRKTKKECDLQRYNNAIAEFKKQCAKHKSMMKSKMRLKARGNWKEDGEEYEQEYINQEFPVHEDPVEEYEQDDSDMDEDFFGKILKKYAEDDEGCANTDDEELVCTCGFDHDSVQEDTGEYLENEEDECDENEEQSECIVIDDDEEDEEEKDDDEEEKECAQEEKECAQDCSENDTEECAKNNEPKILEDDGNIEPKSKRNKENNPWITDELISSIAVKHNLYKIWTKAADTKQPDAADLYNNFKEYRRTLKHAIKSAKAEYYGWDIKVPSENKEPNSEETDVEKCVEGAAVPIGIKEEKLCIENDGEENAELGIQGCSKNNVEEYNLEIENDTVEYVQID